MGGSGLFRVFGGAMDKESVRVVAGGKKAIIDASCFVYKYVIPAGTCAVDFLDRGDVSGRVNTWTSIVRHFKALPIDFVWCLGFRVVKLPISQFNRASQLYFLIDICSFDMA